MYVDGYQRLKVDVQLDLQTYIWREIDIRLLTHIPIHPPLVWLLQPCAIRG